MEKDQLLQENQTATDHGTSDRRRMPPVLPASVAAVLSAHQDHRGPGEGAGRQLSAEFAKAQQKCRRDEVLALRFERAYQDGVFAAADLSSHIRRSLPVGLLAKRTSLRGFLFSVHRGVAGIALRQVLRSARRLGLKRVEDTKGFVSDHCGWYKTFCAFSGWLYARFGI